MADFSTSYDWHIRCTSDLRLTGPPKSQSDAPARRVIRRAKWQYGLVGIAGKPKPTVTRMGSSDSPHREAEHRLSPRHHSMIRRRKLVQMPGFPASIAVNVKGQENAD